MSDLFLELVQTKILYELLIAVIKHGYTPSWSVEENGLLLTKGDYILGPMSEITECYLHFALTH